MNEKRSDDAVGRTKCKNLFISFDKKVNSKYKRDS